MEYFGGKIERNMVKKGNGEVLLCNLRENRETFFGIRPYFFPVFQKKTGKDLIPSTHPTPGGVGEGGVGGRIFWLPC